MAFTVLVASEGASRQEIIRRAILERYERAGHTFDIARQGYANLHTGRRGAKTADTPPMTAARA